MQRKGRGKSKNSFSVSMKKLPQASSYVPGQEVYARYNWEKYMQDTIEITKWYRFEEEDMDMDSDA